MDISCVLPFLTALWKLSTQEVSHGAKALGSVSWRGLPGMEVFCPSVPGGWPFLSDPQDLWAEMAGFTAPPRCADCAEGGQRISLRGISEENFGV